MQLTKGDVIAGRYRIDRRVGAGGMGEVWEGEHLALGVRVAVKTLLDGTDDNPELVARFRREAKLLGRMRSDHVARVLDFVQDREAGLVLVMELVEGKSLAAILESRALDVDEGLDLAIDLATALADLHRAKIVHRDIKPGNVIMQPRATGGARAVLVDFGISRMEGKSEDDSLTGITRADIALGTVEYMAPEQILNSRQVTTASDVYAVGAILYRALAGRHVFGDRRDETLARAKLIDEPPTLASSLPGGAVDAISLGLCTIVDRALKKRPAQRFTTGDQMLDLLLPLREMRRANDLDDETTADGALTLAESLASIEARSAPRDPRASLASIPPAAGAPSGRVGSAPALEVPLHDARPRAMSSAEIPIDAPRSRVPWGPLALALATAFAVGAALAVALVPQASPLLGVVEEPSIKTTPPVASAGLPTVAAAPCPVDPPPAASEARLIDLDEPDPAAPSTRAKPSAIPQAPPLSPPLAAPPPPPAKTSEPAVAPPPSPSLPKVPAPPPRPPPPYSPPPVKDPYDSDLL